MLTDIAVRKAKGEDRPYKKFDKDGLFLLVSPKGVRGWRFKYRFGGKEQQISFGVAASNGPTIVCVADHNEQASASWKRTSAFERPLVGGHRREAAKQEPPIGRQTVRKSFPAGAACSYQAVASSRMAMRRQNGLDARQLSGGFRAPRAIGAAPVLGSSGAITWR